MFLAQDRDHHGEATKFWFERMSIDCKGFEILHKLDDVRFSRNLEKLWFSIQIYRHSRGNVIVQDSVDSTKTQIRSGFSDLHDGRISAEENFLHLGAYSDPDTVLEIALVPLPVHPQLPSWRADLDLVLLTIDLEILVSLVDPGGDNNVAVDDNLSVLQVRLETQFTDSVIVHHDGRCLSIEANCPVRWSCKIKYNYYHENVYLGTSSMFRLLVGSPSMSSRS